MIKHVKKVINNALRNRSLAKKMAFSKYIQRELLYFMLCLCNNPN